MPSSTRHLPWSRLDRARISEKLIAGGDPGIRSIAGEWQPDDGAWKPNAQLVSRISIADLDGRRVLLDALSLLTSLSGATHLPPVLDGVVVDLAEHDR